MVLVATSDRLTLALGVDSPFDRYFAPYMEYRISMPILVELARRGESTNDYSFASIPHALTLGFRGFPLDELALDLGVRLGLSDKPYTGVPATEPWMVMFGASYTLDPRPKVVRKVVEKQVKVPAPEPRLSTGLVAGRILDAKTKQPIAGAQIAYPGMSALTRCGADGQFGGYQLPAGKVQVQRLRRAMGSECDRCRSALGKQQVTVHCNGISSDEGAGRGSLLQSERSTQRQDQLSGGCCGDDGSGTPVAIQGGAAGRAFVGQRNRQGYPPQQQHRRARRKRRPFD